MIDTITTELLALINFPYMLCIVFLALLLKKLNVNWKIKMVYLVLIEAALLGVGFYFLQGTEFTVLMVTYFATTSCYELILKQLLEKLKLK